MTLHISAFGGGVVLAGAADTRSVDEVLEADAVDIGPRGSLVCASDVSPYVALTDQSAAPVAAVLGLASVAGLATLDTLALVQGTSGGSPAYQIALFDRANAASPIAATNVVQAATLGTTPGAAAPVLAGGVQVTTVTTPGVYPMKLGPVGIAVTTQNHAFLINLGAREGQPPASAPGLHVLVLDPPGNVPPALWPIRKFDSLGTGPFGSLNQAGTALGTHSLQLYFTGIASYNGYVFGWGYDSADTTNGDGPCRVMFCNLGQPLKWGNDNIKPGLPAADRGFTDSDAIVLGSAGERIRAGLAIFGKLFVATNRGLHFVQGYGRDTFLTNGATPVMKAYNVVGPGALIEGPDRLMYGVGDQGLWSFDGYNVPMPLFQKVTTYGGASPGWFDLIWTDPTRAVGIPGRTNADLVWMAVDWARQQVLVGIPYCDATAGRGPGADTVVLRYHTRTGGFTRQVFAAQTFTAAGYFRREMQQDETRFLAGVASVARYAYQVTPGASPALPATLPAVTFGYYAPFGPDGEGTVQRLYLTLAWEGVAAQPLRFRVTTSIDDVTVDRYTLHVDARPPAGPAQGDCWLDTSQTDPSLGNVGYGATVGQVGGYLLRLRNGGAWSVLAGSGAAGARTTIPLPVRRVPGTRVAVRVETLSAGGRFELEGLGINPGAGTPDA